LEKNKNRILTVPIAIGSLFRILKRKISPFFNTGQTKKRMSEIATPRLMAAAKEFNIGTNTLIDFLVSRGISEELKPSTKLTETMYRILQSEFQQDKVAHEKAMQIDLPKGASANDIKKKKDEQDLSFNKKETKAKPAEEPKPVEPIIVPEVVEPAKEIPKAEEKEIKETAAELTKIEAPELETPKVLDKIDLDKIDSSTRPKKSAKKTTEKAIDEAKPVEEPVGEISAKTKKAKPVEEKAEEVKVVPEVKEEDTAPVIENIKAKKLLGPKIMGKIE